MQPDLSKTKPDGWPRWLWCLVRLCVASKDRLALLHPDQRAQTACALAEKLVEARQDAKGWRERALSAERCVSYELRNAIKAACERHDKEHGTTLSWRM